MPLLKLRLIIPGTLPRLLPIRGNTLRPVDLLPRDRRMSKPRRDASAEAARNRLRIAVAHALAAFTSVRTVAIDRLVLYPLSAISRAAEKVYGAIRADRMQQAVIPLMQTRAELYDVLAYYAYENKLDALFAERKKHES